MLWSRNKFRLKGQHWRPLHQKKSQFRPSVSRNVVYICHCWSVHLVCSEDNLREVGKFQFGIWPALCTVLQSRALFLVEISSKMGNLFHLMSTRLAEKILDDKDGVWQSCKTSQKTDKHMQNKRVLSKCLHTELECAWKVWPDNSVETKKR